MDFSEALFTVGIIGSALLLLPLLIGGVFVVVVVANRAEPDQSGRRPAVVYAFGVAFITVFVSLFATAAFVASLCQLIGTHDAMPAVYRDSGSLFSDGTTGAQSLLGADHPVGDAVARGAVLSLIVAVVAGVVWALQVRSAANASAGAPVADPVGRVRSSYVAAVSFVCVLIVVAASIVAIYDVFRLIAPGVFSPGGHGSRPAVLRSMIPAAYLAVAALALLLLHLREAPSPFRPRFADRLPSWPWAGATAGVGAPVAAPPQAPEPELPEPPSRPRRAPRKRTDE